jgi:hypothetical protein
MLSEDIELDIAWLVGIVGVHHYPIVPIASGIGQSIDG